jgi:hypothetical protein
MVTVAGIFRAREAAEGAALALQQAGVANINFVAPDDAAQANRIPTTPTEQPGMGAAVGGVLGAALGLAGGFELGTAAASLFVPGVGPVVAAGIAAATLLGAGGAVGGAAAGAAMERETTGGLPEDELYVYKDALRQGRSVVFVQARDAVEATRARKVLDEADAESIDAARDQWWIGLRSAEKAHYQSLGGDFGRDEKAYRRGFEAGLHGAEMVGDEGHAFRHGYERGRRLRP